MPIWNNALFGEKCNIGTSHIRSGGIAYPPMSPLWSWLKIWFIQPKFLHWVHYTPRLASIYPQVDSPVYEVCCIHWYISEHDMVLSCAYPLLGIGNSETLFLLLCHMEDAVADRYTKLLLTYALFYARGEILLRLKSPAPQHSVPGRKPLIWYSPL